MAVICLKEVITSEIQSTHDGRMRSHMKPTLEFPITSKLHEDNLVDEKAHQIERLRHRVSLISCFSHVWTGCDWRL